MPRFCIRCKFCLILSSLHCSYPETLSSLLGFGDGFSSPCLGFAGISRVLAFFLKVTIFPSPPTTSSPSLPPTVELWRREKKYGACSYGVNFITFIRIRRCLTDYRKLWSPGLSWGSGRCQNQDMLSCKYLKIFYSQSEFQILFLERLNPKMSKVAVDKNFTSQKSLFHIISSAFCN